LDTVVTSKRDKAAALKLLKRILKKYGRPLKIVTDECISREARFSALRVAKNAESQVG
jgi:transposase-like protein